jgi:hypothetical protein
MSTCTKYKVIAIYRPELSSVTEIENWLNDLYKHHGYSLVAVDREYYIFSRNAFLSDIKREESNESH